MFIWLFEYFYRNLIRSYSQCSQLKKQSCNFIVFTINYVQIFKYYLIKSGILAEHLLDVNKHTCNSNDIMRHQIVACIERILLPLHKQPCTYNITGHRRIEININDGHLGVATSGKPNPLIVRVRFPALLTSQTIFLFFL